MPLSDDTIELLAQAWLAYEQKIKELLEPYDSDTLEAFAGGAEAIANPTDSFKRALDAAKVIERHAAADIVIWRPLFEAADRQFKSGGSGVYCVFHRGDIQDCYEQHRSPEKTEPESN